MDRLFSYYCQICTSSESFLSHEPQRNSAADRIFSSFSNTQTKLRRASRTNLTQNRMDFSIASQSVAQRSIVTGRNGDNRIGKFLGGSQLHKSSREGMEAATRVTVGSGNGGLGKSWVTGIGERDGVIIVDHGSRRKESNLMLNEFATMFQERTGYVIVESAHMELAKPSIQDAFTACVQRGAIRVIVSPFFLLPGRHWQQDIPSLTAEAAKLHPGVPYIISAPLGLHELLVGVMDDRINHCLSHVAGEADECDVCSGTGKCRLHQSSDAQNHHNSPSVNSP